MGADLSRSMLLAASAIDGVWDMPASVVPLCRWYFGRICRNFHSHANSGMISRHRWRVERGIMIRCKGAHFAKDIILTCIRWVCGVSLKLPPARRDEARARGLGRPRDHQPLGAEVYSPARSRIPPPQAARVPQLAPG
jgi:hypothetical protein